MNSLVQKTQVSRRHLATAVALVAVVATMGLAPLPAANAADTTVLAVVGDADQPTSGETAMTDHLTSTGLAVTLASDEDATPFDAAAHDLVWISSNVSPATVHDDLPTTTTPVIVSKPWLFDDFGLTDPDSSNYGSTTTTAITITNPDDPTAGGLNGDIALTPGRTLVSTANPTNSATIVATANGTPTIFRVRPGDLLANSTPAPACRLSFPAFKNEPATHNPDAWTLLDATTTHALTNCTTGNTTPPERQILFGMHPGVQRDTELITIENSLGRRLDLVRVFERWDAEPDGYIEQVVNGGRTMVLSLRAKRSNGSLLSWREIAEAEPGSALHDQMVRWADRVGSLQGEVMFSFNHEPEVVENIASGDAEDYIAAWHRMREVFAAEGVDNVRWTWIMTDWSFHVSNSDRRAADHWYPGDDAVDVLGVDAYNWAACHPGAGPNWRSLAAAVGPFREFAQQHPDEDMLIAEWASPEGASGEKASWIHDVRVLFTQPGWGRLVGVSYFNENSAQPTCSFPVTSSTSSFDAFKAMANDPAYGGGS